MTGPGDPPSRPLDRFRMAVASLVLVTWSVLHLIDAFDAAFETPFVMDVICGSVLVSLFPGMEKVIRALWGKNGNGS